MSLRKVSGYKFEAFKGQNGQKRPPKLWAARAENESCDKKFCAFGKRKKSQFRARNGKRWCKNNRELKGGHGGKEQGGGGVKRALLFYS